MFIYESHFHNPSKLNSEKYFRCHILNWIVIEIDQLTRVLLAESNNWKSLNPHESQVVDSSILTYTWKCNSLCLDSLVFVDILIKAANIKVLIIHC